MVPISSELPLSLGSATPFIFKEIELGPGILKTISSISFKKPNFSDSPKLPRPSIFTSISIGSSSMKNLLPGACCAYNIKIVTTVKTTKTINFPGDAITLARTLA